MDIPETGNPAEILTGTEFRYIPNLFVIVQERRKIHATYRLSFMAQQFSLHETTFVREL